MDGAVQHDAHELNRLLIEALERSLKHTKGDVLCQLYKGLLVNQTRCTGCDFVSDRPEHYYDLNVQVNNFDDLVGSLRQYCAAEVLEGDSAYQCDRCQGRRRALRSTVLRDLPQVLTLSCLRFKIDQSTNWQRQKVTTKSVFPLILDMNVFAEGSEGSAAEPYTGNTPSRSPYNTPSHSSNSTPHPLIHLSTSHPIHLIIHPIPFTS